MNLLLERTWPGTKCTIGLLSINGAYECFTLEDVVRPVKIAGRTAIPPSLGYNLVITYSRRFKRELPLIENVQGFEGVRIHPGNTAEDTEGCILVGLSKGKEYVSESRKAFDALYPKIMAALNGGEKVTLEVR